MVSKEQVEEVKERLDLKDSLVKHCHSSDYSINIFEFEPGDATKYVINMVRIDNLKPCNPYTPYTHFINIANFDTKPLLININNSLTYDVITLIDEMLTYEKISKEYTAIVAYLLIEEIRNILSEENIFIKEL